MLPEGLFQFLRDANSVLLVGAVILILLGAVTPTQLFGVTIEWTSAKSWRVLGIGVLLFIASLPQVRQFGIIKIDVESLNVARDEATQCAGLAYAASTNTSDVRTCTLRGAQAQGHGNAAVSAINKTLSSIK
ncbi:hypothetical protein [Methylobacterium sp. 190mf]|uniref:hypothetical protein n=1 Tax=Methylobacterium sp. 190mf TaxID=1761798 RepID=UPI0011B03991|nr:hypothetical protein [Methylobacterium sp. 190mf]